jgi:hypothetical protein
MFLVFRMAYNENSGYRYCTYSGSICSEYFQILMKQETTGVRSPTEAEDFSSSFCIQTGSGAHPVSCTMGTGVLSPGVNRGRGMMLTIHPRLMPRLRMSRSYTSSPSHAPPCSAITLLPVTVAVRSEAWVLAGWLLGLWVRIPLKAWMFVRVFLCCVVL